MFEFLNAMLNYARNVVIVWMRARLDPLTQYHILLWMKLAYDVSHALLVVPLGREKK